MTVEALTATVERSRMEVRGQWGEDGRQGGRWQLRRGRGALTLVDISAQGGTLGGELEGGCVVLADVTVKGGVALTVIGGESGGRSSRRSWVACVNAAARGACVGAVALTTGMPWMEGGSDSSVEWRRTTIVVARAAMAMT